MTKNLTDDVCSWNTPAARMLKVNAPAWADGLTFDTHPDRRAVELVKQWVDRASRGLILEGETGSGKTGLAICALRELAARGFGSRFEWNLSTSKLAPGYEDFKELPSPCWFESWSVLLDRYRSERRRQDDERPGWFESLEDISALVLDDPGVVSGTTSREAFLLRHLEWAVVRRGRVLILTTALDQEEWSESFGVQVTRRMLEDSRFMRVRVDHEVSA